MPRVALLLCLFALASTLGATAADPALARYDRVEVPAAKTFYGIASVTMTMPAFKRVGATYETDYRASVVPWVMFNEKGRLTVEISDDQLRALARGETIEFKGRAVREGGGERRVEGRIAPADATHGKLKVRVYYSKRINLGFETTYRFSEAK